jgi:Trypsin-like peptidase domain
MTISRFSLRSLLLHPIEVLYDGPEKEMASATGFVVEIESQHYLITNWHVVSGRRPDSGQAIEDHGGTPRKIKIWHNRLIGPDKLTWVSVIEPLYGEDGKPLWLEHPQFGRQVDVVALPLTITADISFLTHKLEEEPPALKVDVPDTVYIIGFPFGIVARGKVAIWVQGSVATDIDIDYGNLPCFLVDSRTRRGQSGSPVLGYRGRAQMALMEDGDTHISDSIISRLLGVYSGRFNEESDLGRVWKTSAIIEILKRGAPGNADLIS